MNALYHSNGCRVAIVSRYCTSNVSRITVTGCTRIDWSWAHVYRSLNEDQLNVGSYSHLDSSESLQYHIVIFQEPYRDLPKILTCTNPSQFVKDQLSVEWEMISRYSNATVSSRSTVPAIVRYLPSRAWMTLLASSSSSPCSQSIFSENLDLSIALSISHVLSPCLPGARHCVDHKGRIDNCICRLGFTVSSTVWDLSLHQWNFQI